MKTYFWAGQAPVAIDGATLVANPSSIRFGRFEPINEPVVVTLTGFPRIGNSFTLRVGDPTQTGASQPAIETATTAKMLVYPISHGQRGTTTITVRDSRGASARVSVYQESCLRARLPVGEQVIFPPTKTMSPAVGELYFEVYKGYTIGAPRPPFPEARLHLAVGEHGTLEGAGLQQATPPPLTASPTPLPGPWIIYYAKSSVPALPPHARIRTQIYDRNCQPPTFGSDFITR